MQICWLGFILLCFHFKQEECAHLYVFSPSTLKHTILQFTKAKIQRRNFQRRYWLSLPFPRMLQAVNNNNTHRPELARTKCILTLNKIHLTESGIFYRFLLRFPFSIKDSCILIHATHMIDSLGSLFLCVFKYLICAWAVKSELE